MTRKREIYKGQTVVGMAEFTKKFEVHLVFNEEIHYSNETVELDRFDERIARLGLTMNPGQLKLF